MSISDMSCDHTYLFPDHDEHSDRGSANSSLFVSLYIQLSPGILQYIPGMRNVKLGVSSLIRHTRGQEATMILSHQEAGRRGGKKRPVPLSPFDASSSCKGLGKGDVEK